MAGRSGGVGTGDDAFLGGVAGAEGACRGEVNQPTQGADDTPGGAGVASSARRSRRLIADGPDLSDLEPLQIPSPPDVRKGCREYWRFKFMKATELAQRALAVPTLGPKALGALTIESFKAALKKRTALSDTSGSFRLNEIEATKKRKREAEAEAEERKRGTREQRHEKKTAKETTAELARILWEACSGGECKCEELEVGESCRQLPFLLCLVCECLKRRDCRVQACLDRGREVRCVIIPTPPLVVEEVRTIAPTRLVFGSAPGAGDVGDEAGVWVEGVWFGVGGSGDAAFPDDGVGNGETCSPPPLVAPPLCSMGLKKIVR